MDMITQEVLLGLLANQGSTLAHLNPPTVVAVGTQAHGTGTVVPGLPTGWAQGDLLMILVEGAGEPAEPSGYNLLVSIANANASSFLGIAWKIAGSSETAPTVPDTGDHTIARMIAFRGVGDDGDDPASPWLDNAAPDSSGNSASPQIPALTTVTENTLLVRIVWSGTDTTTAQISSAGSWNNGERMDDWTTDGNGGGFAMSTAAGDEINTYTALTVTKATSDQWGALIFAIRGVLE